MLLFSFFGLCGLMAIWDFGVSRGVFGAYGVV